MPQISESTQDLVLFLQSVIFTVLKVHGLYAAQSFQRCRLRLGDVWWSNCVQVEDYVTKLCESLAPAINRGRVQAVRLHVQADGGGQCYVLCFAKLPSSLDLAEMRAVLARLEMAFDEAPALPSTAAPSAWRVTVETRPPEAGERRQEALPVPRWRETSVSSSSASSGEVLPLGSVRGMDGSMAISLHREDAAVNSSDVVDVLMVSSQDETPKRLE
mmetsp:Transcript_73209/g.120792  ORF Transcript_73209/g.120792 Transcript_73209/m.120792 type:complete len:216 (+) Transcript_73209:59-706(+)